jgi:hypothetical protein
MIEKKQLTSIYSEGGRLRLLGSLNILSFNNLIDSFNSSICLLVSRISFT